MRIRQPDSKNQLVKEGKIPQASVLSVSGSAGISPLTLAAFLRASRKQSSGDKTNSVVQYQKKSVLDAGFRGYLSHLFQWPPLVREMDK